MIEFRPALLTSLKHYSREKFTADLMAGIIVGIVALPLAIAFGIANKFEEQMVQLGDHAQVRIIRMRKVPFIDSTGIHNLTNLCRISQQENTRIILSGVNPKVHEVLHKAGFYSLLGEENICPNINAALRRAKELVVEPKEK